MKKILLLSHCILNKASKVEQDEKELQEEYLIRSELMKLINEQDIQMIQLPCPEYLMYGADRWGHVADQFDHPFFRKTCEEIFQPYLLQIKGYLKHPDRFCILGIVSVEGSPSCGWNLTCTGEWRGELSDIDAVKKKVATLEMKQKPGVFMEEISSMLEKEGIKVPIYSMQEAIDIIKEHGGK